MTCAEESIIIILSKFFQILEIFFDINRSSIKNHIYNTIKENLVLINSNGAQALIDVKPAKKPLRKSTIISLSIEFNKIYLIS